ncbi:hypothetical protein BGX21_005015, partial [Mortierella sp. AD011]
DLARELSELETEETEALEAPETKVWVGAKPTETAEIKRCTRTIYETALRAFTARQNSILVELLQDIYALMALKEIEQELQACDALRRHMQL